MACRQLLTFILLGVAAAPVGAATFTVSSTAASGAGSLADAITQANNTAGADTINFGISGTGVKVLTVPTNGYPQITETLVIDGYTQTGATVNNTATGSTNALLRIELNASGMATTSSVLRMNAPTTLRGVAISNLPGQANAINVPAGGAGSSIRGCFLGTTAAGVAVGGGDGINATGSTQIGSSTPADRNLFAGVNTGVFASGTGTVIQGNLFGTFANGTTGGNQGLSTGVSAVTSSSDVTIGGTAAGQGNVFRDFDAFAVRLFDGTVPATGISILGNSIDGVGLLPIDLGGDGVDPIDSGDGDIGPNGRENTATLFYARRHGSQLRAQLQIDGNFTGAAKRLEFFASPSAHPSGSGAGAEFLASVNFNPPAGSRVEFLDLNLTATALPSLILPQVITATVTSAGGSTSEFSNAVELIEGGQLRVVTNIDDSGTGSLRQQILDANGNAGMDSIIFNLLDSAIHTITPTSALPDIAGPLLIDGYSQNRSQPNFAILGSNAVLRISLDGSSTASENLLEVISGQLIVRGLNLRNASNTGIALTGGGNHIIEGCFIGTGIDGTGDQGSFGSGITSNLNGNQVGGPGLHQRNVISGNNGVGVNFGGSNWVVENNVMGTAADGVNAIGNSFGAIAASGSGRIVGNRIRNNSTRGIGLPAGAVQVEISANAIFTNAGIGIDLGNNGVTLNDVNDADSGPNGLQNFPVLSAVTSLANGNLRVEGSLDRPSSGSHTYRFEVFRSGNCDTGGHGEGEQFLGSATVAYIVGVPETFSFDLDNISLPDGTVITATATRTSGETSEFSACLSSTVQPDAVFANGFE